MRRSVPVAKVIGFGVFEVGCVILALSIINLAPSGRPALAGFETISTLLINMLVLIMATFVISTGMFFYIYSEDKNA